MVNSFKNAHVTKHGSKVKLDGITNNTIKNWKREKRRRIKKRYKDSVFIKWKKNQVEPSLTLKDIWPED